MLLPIIHGGWKDTSRLSSVTTVTHSVVGKGSYGMKTYLLEYEASESNTEDTVVKENRGIIDLREYDAAGVV